MRDNGPRTRSWGTCCVPLVALLVLQLALPCCAIAQFRIDHWTTNEGLPQNSVRDIVQTPDGYIWFTTFDGLVRFDGVRFTIFDKRATGSLAGNRFGHAAVDRHGTLWASSEGGGITIYRDGRFTSFLPAGFRSGVAPMLDLDLDGEMLIGFPEQRYYLRNGRLVEAAEIYQPGKGAFLLGPTGTRWIADGRGVTEIRNGTTTRYPLTLSYADSAFFGNLFEDRSGHLWVGDRSRMFRLKEGKITTFTERDGIPPGILLYAYCDDGAGGVLMAAHIVFARGVGIVRYHNGRFQIIDRRSGLSDNLVTKIFADREGTIWAATNRGLNRIRRSMITTISTDGGLAGNEVYPILEDSAHTVWVGTTAGLSRVVEGKAEPFPPGNDLPVQALWKDRLGRLWIGTVGILYRYHQGKLELVHTQPSLIVWAIRDDNEGNVWVATNQGVVKFRGDSLVQHLTTVNGLPDNDVKVITPTRDGAVWFGTYGGLARLKNGRIQKVTASNGLAGNQVRAIHEDEQGVLWVGTYDDGVSRICDGSIFNFTTANGLFDNGAFVILPDGNGSFWFSSNRGIYRVRRSELEAVAEGTLRSVTSVPYGMVDGMRNNECNGGRQPAGIVAQDGRLWFPTMDGVAIIDPRDVHTNLLAPPVRIEEILLERLRQPLSNRLTIEPGQRDLEIRYTGLSSVKPEQIRFRYRLEGQDTAWIDADSRRTIYYNYIPPGEYTFRVIAANSDGVWGQQGASLRIVSLAPVWRRPWFTATVAAITVGIGALAYRTRIRKLERSRAAHQEFSRRLIESQEGERKRIASELHDSIGQSLLIIRNWAIIGLNNSRPDHPAVPQLTEISATTSNALEEVRLISQNLRPYQLERIGLTKSLQQMMRRIQDATDIEFVSAIDNVDGLLPDPLEINLYRIVQESVNNVIKHSGATRASLVVTRSDEGASITCYDNGRGFDPEAVNASTTRGLGLTGLSERARMIGAELIVHSAPGMGTTISIDIVSQGAHDGSPDSRSYSR